jgi:hypothetical protein
MVPYLHVSVRLYDTVVDDRLCEVKSYGWLGDSDDAIVPFPGGSLWVEREGDVISLQGHPLEIGEPVRMTYGQVEVVIEAVLPEALPRDWSWVPDPAILVATAGLVLAGAFVDTLLASAEVADLVALPVVEQVVDEAARSAGRVNVAEGSYPENAADTGDAIDAWPPSVTFSPE